jgi:hypothetical protein
MKAYQLKITLQCVKPPVWRRIIVPADLKFSQLRVIMTEAMGWIGGHLYGFRFEKEKLFINHNFKGMHIVESTLSPDFCYVRADAREVKIDELLREGLIFYFDYDFGDAWVHKIKVEKVLDDCPNDCPRVIKYAGDCPPEDVGGPDGYENFLRIINDPSDPEYEKTLKWGRSQFYVEYDADEVNAELENLSSCGYSDDCLCDGADGERASRATPVGPHSFLAIADRLQTMDENELRTAFENSETLFGYMIFEREPVFDLRSLLDSFRCKDLRAVASQMDLPGRSGLRKNELIEAIYDCYTNSTLLHAVIGRTEETQINVLRDIMSEEVYYVTDEAFPYDFALTLLINLVITAFYDGDRIAVIALRESKEKYIEALEELREIFDDILNELDEYACATVNLYGVIAMGDFMSVYTDQTGSDFDEEAVRQFLSDVIDDEAGETEYRIRGDFLISDVLEDWSDDEIADLHEKSQMYPLCVPSKEELMQYVDWFCFEKTPAHREFIEWLRDRIKPDADNEAQPDLVAGEICAILRQWGPMEECFTLLDSFGVALSGPKEMRHVTRLISGMLDNTRVWGYNGATPNELFSMKSGKLPYKNPERRIGRNDPCPCGSGKKYKHCCGRLLH